MCGFIGLLGPTGRPAVSTIYDALIAIQHRGQDAAGIATFDGQFHLVKGDGLVRDIFHPGNVGQLTGHLGLGHVRYPTYGGGGPEDAQPFVLQSPFGIAMVHNGQVTNFDELKTELRQCRRLVNSGCDVEVILHVFADELDRHVPPGATPEFAHIKRAVEGVHRRVRGAYSVVAAIANVGMVGFRDPFGIRPMVLGTAEIDGETCYLTASETVAHDLTGFKNQFDLRAGEVVLCDMNRNLHRAVCETAKPHRPCIFEYVYFARPDSFLENISVYHARVRMGRALAEAWKKTGLHVDAIVPVPDSSRPAAIEMAMQLGVKLREGLIKNRYIGRTFIMPGNTDRRRAVRHKLNTVRHVFEGNDVLLVDDSIVRGNTIKELIKMARDAGARKVYFASYSAPLKFPCVYGIDMSTKRDFIARDHTVDEICKEVGADFLLYESLDDMVAVTQLEEAEPLNYCTACFTGNYPTGDVPDEVLAHFEAVRTAPAGAPQK